MTFTQREPGDPFAAPGTATLQTVLDRLEQIPNMTTGRKNDLRSAIRTFCKVAGRDPRDIVAGPIRIRHMLAQCYPARFGISHARWNNVRSLLSKTMDLTGISVAPGRMLAPMTPDWRELYDRLPTKEAKCILSRVLRHLSVRGVDPKNVTVSDIQRFEQDNARSVLKDPVRANQKMRRGWNRARVTVEGWPDLELEIAALRDTYTVPLEALAASYRDDAEAFLEWSGRRDSFDEDDGPIRPVRPATVRNKRQAIVFMTSAAIRNGTPSDQFRSLGDLVEPETVKTALRFLAKRYGDHQSAVLENMMAQIVIIARDWVKVRDDQLEPLRRLGHRVAPKRRGTLTEKNRAVIREFDDRSMILRLVRLPDLLFDLACREPEHSKVRGFKQATAVMVAILLAAPIRVRNLVGIYLGRNLLRIAHNKSNRYELYFPADEVKNDVELAMPLPDWVGQMIDAYTRDGRQLLLDEPSDWLFPGLTKGHVCTATVTARLAAVSQRHLGVKITPHQFRHIAGALYLFDNPGQHEVVRRLLGHKNLNTTVTFYAAMQQPAATRDYAATIEARRQEALQTTPRSHKRRTA
ncbi:MAG: tyrosine-type recombinase/integrase [Parvibaculaceae bacterium]